MRSLRGRPGPLVQPVGALLQSFQDSKTSDIVHGLRSLYNQVSGLPAQPARAVCEVYGLSLSRPKWTILNMFIIFLTKRAACAVWADSRGGMGGLGAQHGRSGGLGGLVHGLGGIWGQPAWAPYYRVFEIP